MPSAECVRSEAQTRASARKHRVHAIACVGGHRLDPSCAPRPLANPRERHAAAALHVAKASSSDSGGKGGVWSFVLRALGSLDRTTTGDCDSDFVRQSGPRPRARSSDADVPINWFSVGLQAGCSSVGSSCPPPLSLCLSSANRLCLVANAALAPWARAYMRRIHARTKQIFRPETSSHHACIILALCCVAPPLRCRQSRLAAWFRPRLHDTDEDP